MPWWAILYLVVFIAGCIIADGVKEPGSVSRAKWLADIFANAVFAVLFVGFWLQAVHRALGLTAPILLFAAFAWEIYSSPEDLRKIWRDPNLSPRERIGITLLAPLFGYPLFLTAAIGVFRFHVRV